MAFLAKDSFRNEREPQTSRQEVEYPAVFPMRVIVEVEIFDSEAMAAVLERYKVVSPWEKSQASSSGRYQAFGVSVEVTSFGELAGIDAEVKAVRGVRMLL